MTAKTEELARCRKIVAQALLEDWDPIGIAEFRNAFDEYGAYVDDICRLVASRQSKEAIFDYLWQLETVHMGLTGRRAETEKFADWLTHLPQMIEKSSDL